MLQPAIFLSWIVLTILVGYVGSKRLIGFWGAFIISLLLSPFVGFIVALMSKDKEEHAYKLKMMEVQEKQLKALTQLLEQRTM